MTRDEARRAVRLPQVGETGEGGEMAIRADAKLKRRARLEGVQGRL